jgi:MFS family permease
MCSLAAAVQGMDETVNNGAQDFYLKRFNIVEKSKGGRFTTNEVDNLTGLVVGAPYLACAILGCWLTEPLNSVFARRGTIFISCFIAAVASIVSSPYFMSFVTVTFLRTSLKEGICDFANALYYARDQS